MINQFLKQGITIYWWNCGNKTLDFKGSLKDYLEKRNIKYTTTKEGNYKFKFTVGRTKVESVESNFDSGAFTVIKLYLTAMGDKTIIEMGGRKQKLNWR
jgi:hypothetical protein